MEYFCKSCVFYSIFLALYILITLLLWLIYCWLGFTAVLFFFFLTVYICLAVDVCHISHCIFMSALTAVVKVTSVVALYSWLRPTHTPQNLLSNLTALFIWLSSSAQSEGCDLSDWLAMLTAPLIGAFSLSLCVCVFSIFILVYVLS